MKNHYSGKKKKLYMVITSERTTNFYDGGKANSLREKLRKKGLKVKIKTKLVNLGEEYKREKAEAYI